MNKIVGGLLAPLPFVRALRRIAVGVVRDTAHEVGYVTLRPQPDGSLAFVTIDPVAAGFPFVRADKDGVRKLVVRDGQHELRVDPPFAAQELPERLAEEELEHEVHRAVAALDADAQPTVYRCGQDGREYSSTPCPGGRAVPVDDFTRECLALVADTSLSGTRVAMNIADIPQTVSVVTSDFIKDTMSQRMRPFRGCACGRRARSRSGRA